MSRGTTDSGELSIPLVFKWKSSMSSNFTDLVNIKTLFSGSFLHCSRSFCRICHSSLTRSPGQHSNGRKSTYHPFPTKVRYKHCGAKLWSTPMGKRYVREFSIASNLNDGANADTTISPNPELNNVYSQLLTCSELSDGAEYIEKQRDFEKETDQ